MNLHHTSALRMLAAACVLASTGAAFAQTAEPATPRIDQREQRQDTRIENGTASGQLNARETNRLEHQQTHIDNMESRAKADGQVSRLERARITREQNQANRRIKIQKHDRQRTAPAS
ncbi:hypothetical protein ACO2Q9_14365 [Variovorax sp. VNK109]|uniref:hypothetical protein n=1 Tax=Variovorax sp. VNK109 TaxID=3400919 RepID=UPI003C007404